MAVSPIPAGFGSITPYLIVSAAAAAIEYYQTVFEADVRLRMDTPDGKVGHAELQIGNSRLMLADEWPNIGMSSPLTLGGASMSLLLYVEDCDTVFKRAIEQGATQVKAPENQFWGDRSGTLKDPFGHVWSIATHIEDVSDAEMTRRAAEWMKNCTEAG